MPDVFNSQKLDEYEQELEDALTEKSFRSVPDAQAVIAEAQLIGANTLKKNRSITIRMSDSDLMRIKRLAAREGMPYQTLISSVLHKLACGHDHWPNHKTDKT